MFQKIYFSKNQSHKNTNENKISILRILRIRTPYKKIAKQSSVKTKNWENNIFFKVSDLKEKTQNYVTESLKIARWLQNGLKYTKYQILWGFRQIITEENELPIKIMNHLETMEILIVMRSVQS